MGLGWWIRPRFPRLVVDVVNDNGVETLYDGDAEKVVPSGEDSPSRVGIKATPFYIFRVDAMAWLTVWFIVIYVVAVAASLLVLVFLFSFN